jgi:hypothetical protein
MEGRQQVTPREEYLLWGTHILELETNTRMLVTQAEAPHAAQHLLARLTAPPHQTEPHALMFKGEK